MSAAPPGTAVGGDVGPMSDGASRGASPVEDPPDGTGVGREARHHGADARDVLGPGVQIEVVVTGSVPGAQLGGREGGRGRDRNGGTGTGGTADAGCWNAGCCSATQVR